MKKVIIMAAAAFIVALGGSVALRVLTAKAPPKPALEAGAVADSAGVHAEEDAMHAEQTAGQRDEIKAEEHGDGAIPDAEPQGAEHLTTVSEAAKIETPASPAEPPAIVEQAAAPEEDYEVLAKILGNMKAAESSQILLHLSDQQAEGVLRRINPRLAAQILAKIPPDRAGALSQRLLVPRGENP